MSSLPLLVCMKLPFQPRPYLFAKVADTIVHVRSANYVYRFDTIVCHGFQSIVPHLSTKIQRSLPVVLDVVTAKILVTGRPKSDYGIGAEPWALKRLLRRHVRQETARWLNDIEELRIASPEDNPAFKENVIDLMNGFEEVWRELEADLDSKGEAERFFEVEAPIYNLFLETQLQGIPLSHERLDKKLIELVTKQYSAVKKLELEYGFVSQRVESCRRFDDIKGYCALPHVLEVADGDLWRYVDLYAEYDPFLDLLTSARYCGKDYRALLRYSVTTQRRIYPEFEVMGTVTGRILVSKPGIQYLKKTSRDIFVPPDGACFIYADFDQFEPGIAAQFSQDKNLIKLYNEGDVYSALSTTLFKTEEKRKLAKIIFLSFMYGISVDRLEKLILNIGKEEILTKQGMAFLNEFETLRDWKDGTCTVAQERGYASSCLGNRRYLTSTGQLTEKEKRWVPNQTIQGTASYIFKKAILALRKEAKDVQFLIPMHDAILLQAEEHREEEVKKIVERVFKETFVSVCPDIKPGVSFDAFSE